MKHRRPLLPEIKCSPGRQQVSIKLANSVCANCNPSVSAGERSVRFIQGGHPFNVARICSRDQ